MSGEPDNGKPQLKATTVGGGSLKSEVLFLEIVIWIWLPWVYSMAQMKF